MNRYGFLAASLFVKLGGSCAKEPAEIIRELTINPDKNSQPRGAKAGPGTDPSLVDRFVFFS
jgi:hypothetical protein